MSPPVFYLNQNKTNISGKFTKNKIISLKFPFRPVDQFLPNFKVKIFWKIANHPRHNIPRALNSRVPHLLGTHTHTFFFSSTLTL